MTREHEQSVMEKNHCYLGEKRERIFSRYFTGQFCAGCFDYIGTCLSHGRNTKGLVPIAYVMEVVWPSTPANSFQMLVSTAVAISHGGCSPHNVMIQSKIKSREREKLPPPELASGTDIIGILINLKIDLRVEWRTASFTLSIYSLFKKYCY